MIPPEAVEAIVSAGAWMDRQGWVPATAGNISLRLGADRVAITRSGAHKGRMTAEAVMLVDIAGRALDPAQRPSYETLLHCGVYRRFPEAGAVVHGHSLANTVLSRLAGDAVILAGYELLKAFPGLATHDAAVAVPVLDNDQDIPRLQAVLERRWDGMGAVTPPGYLIRGHGVYVWAPDMPAALARLEALEFMLACEVQASMMGSGAR